MDLAPSLLVEHPPIGRSSEPGRLRASSELANSVLKLSSASSQDSLPLGCEHMEYYWIKRYRALKRHIEGGAPDASADAAEEREADILEALQAGTLLKLSGGHQRVALLPPIGKMPCTRCFLEEENSLLGHFKALLGVASEGVGSCSPSAASGSVVPSGMGLGRQRLAMLRTQQSLVISPVSSRWFVLEASREMSILIGATTEGAQRLQPCDLERIETVTVEARRGDRIKLLAMPALGYAPEGCAASDPAGSDFQLRGDLTVMVNGRSESSMHTVHNFQASASIFGLAIWLGSLSDVRLIEV